MSMIDLHLNITMEEFDLYERGLSVFQQQEALAEAQRISGQQSQQQYNTATPIIEHLTTAAVRQAYIETNNSQHQPAFVQQQVALQQ